MAAVRRSPMGQPTDDEMDQQTLLQQLTGQPATTVPGNERVTIPDYAPNGAPNLAGGLGLGDPNKQTTPEWAAQYGDTPLDGSFAANNPALASPLISTLKETGSSALANNPNTGFAGGMDKSVSPSAAGWDTDGYAAPSYTATDFGGPMAGWDATKWNNANNQHPKYVVGRILSKYSPDDAGTQAAVQEIMKAYPGTTFDGKDKITVPGLGTIDFRKGAGAGGTGWQWDDLTNGGGSTAAAAGTSAMTVPGGSTSSVTNALTSGSTYQELMTKLRAILGTNASPDQMDQQTLLSQLGQ